MSGEVIVLILFIFGLVVWNYGVRVRDFFASAPAAASAAAGTGASPTAPPTPPQEGWLRKNLWPILAIIAGGAVLLLLIVWLWPAQSPSLQSPNLKTMWEWTKNYWLLILFAIGIAYVLSYLFKKDKESLAKAARGFLVSVLAILFVGVPVCNWIWSEKPQSEQPEQQEPLLKSPRLEIPLATAPMPSWPKLALPAKERSERIPVPPRMHIVMIGNNFRLHNVYLDGHECAFADPCVAGSLAGNYATNGSDETNIISYAFAPD